MDYLEEQDLRTHVTILGWLLIVGHAVLLLVGAFVFMLLLLVAPFTGDRDALVILPVVGMFVGGLLTFLGLPGIVAGWALLKRWAWGRVLAIIVAVLSLPNFPLGTAIGCYALWVLLQQSASAYFAQPSQP